MKRTDEIVDFFREVQRVIGKHGIDKVLQQLRSIHSESDEGLEHDVSEYILVETSNHYCVSKDDVLYSRKRGVISEARRMCFALMKEHLTVSDEQIGDKFDRSRQFINKELSGLPLNQDNFATKDEANFVKDFIQLTTKVLHYRNGYKLNKTKETL